MLADDRPADVFAVPASSGRVVSVPVHRISVRANLADAGATILSIPRVHVAGADVATCEFLFCAAFEPAGPGTPIISVAGSQSLKGNSRVTRTGLIVENISVA